MYVNWMEGVRDVIKGVFGLKKVDVILIRVIGWVLMNDLFV